MDHLPPRPLLAFDTPAHQEASNFAGSDRCNLLALLLILTLINLPLLLFNHTSHDLSLFDHDFPTVVYPGVDTRSDLYRSGMALWNPYLLAGLPSLGLILSGSLYPVNYFFQTLSFIPTFKINFLLHVLITGLSYYALFRSLRIRPFPTLIAALVAVLAGFNWWNSLWEISQRTVALYPLVFLFVFRLIQARELKSFFALPPLFYLLIAAGDIEMVFFGMLGLGLHFLVLALSSRQGFVRISQSAGLIALGGIWGSLLCSAQILPFLDLVSQSVRSQGFSLEFYRSSFASFWQLFPGLIILISKFTAIHFPVTIIVIAGAAGWSRRREPLVLSSLLVLTLFILMVGSRETPLSWLMYHLPLVNKFIRHYKLGMVINFQFMILAAIGLQDLLHGKLLRSRWWILALAFVFDALVNPFPWWVKISALILSGAATASFVGRWQKRLFPALLLAQALLMIFPKLAETNGELTEYRYHPEVETFLQKHQGIHRTAVMYPFTFRLEKEYPPGKTPLQLGYISGTYAIDSWFSFPQKRYINYLKLINSLSFEVEGFPDNEILMKSGFKSVDFIRPTNRNLVDLLGLKYIIADQFALRLSDNYRLLFDPRLAADLRQQGVSFDLHRPAVTLAPGESALFRLDINAGDELWYELEPDVPDQIDWLIESRELPVLPRPTLVSGSSYRAPLGDSDLPQSVLMLSLAGTAPRPVTIINPVIRNPRHTIKLIQSGAVDVFENQNVLPRAFVVGQAIVARDPIQAKELLSQPEKYDIRHWAVLEGPMPGLGGFKTNVDRARVEVKRYEPERIEVKVSTDEGGILVLTDNYFIGWKAWIDGLPVRIYPADLTFRGVSVPAGNHTVEFIYQPESFGMGLWLSLTTAACWLLALLPILAASYPRARNPKTTPLPVA